MTFNQHNADYVVMVTQIGHGYELSIHELLLSVRALNLNDGWRLIQERKHEVIDCALAAGLVDELPIPGSPAFVINRG